MTIQVGDELPSQQVLKLAQWSDEGGNYCGVPKEIDLQTMCKNKRVVIFGVPGAFTPTCHTQHVQGFMDRFSEFAKFNIESISCIASNDVFVMGAWAKQLNAKSLLFLADGNLEFLGKIGLTQDLSAFGLGVRGHRFAMIVDDCKVLYLGVGDLEVSGAEAVLNKLQTLFA